MTTHQIQFKHVNGQLVVDSPTGLKIGEGRYRALFVSNAQMTPADSSNAYSTTIGTRTAKTIDELCAYLGERGIDVQIDNHLQGLVDLHRNANQALAQARERGNEVREGRFTPATLPGFTRTLKAYQIPAVAHMVAVQHAANFSVPGSGKTTMVLAAYAELRSQGICDKLLVVGPRACFAPWEDEFAKCFDRPAISVRLTGTPLERFSAYAQIRSSSVDLTLVSYQMVGNDSDDILALLKAGKYMMVLDEAHYIKRFTGGVWAQKLVQLAPFATKRVILTGTPMPNGLEDLWSQMSFLWPSPPVLGTREAYVDRLSFGEDMAGELIRDELRPLYWRVRKSDVQLPPPTFHILDVPMKQHQEKIYAALAQRTLADIHHVPAERDKLRQWRRARMVRLLQAATNPSLLAEFSEEFQVPALDASGMGIVELVEHYSKVEIPHKLEAVVKLVDDLIAKGQKVIVWTVFVHNIKVLAKVLERHSPRVIYGAVPKDADSDAEFNREKMIEQFKTSTEFPLLIANPAACAESISLHKICRHAIYMDRTFNAAQYIQSLDRIHRLGLELDEHVHYYLFRSLHTVDLVVHDRLETKHKKLLTLLEDDLQVIDLDDCEGVSEVSDEEQDFSAIVDQLRHFLASQETLATRI